MEMADFLVLVQKRTKQFTSAEDFYEFLKLDFLRPASSGNMSKNLVEELIIEDDVLVLKDKTEGRGQL